jgi:PAS domain S-box-containing protein
MARTPIRGFKVGLEVVAALGLIGTAVQLPLLFSRILNVLEAANTSEVSTDRLRLVMESGKSVGWDWEIQTGRDCWFGDIETIFGIPSNVFFGHVEDFRRRVHPDDRAIVWKAVNDAKEQRKPYAAEFRVLRTDGSARWISAKGEFHYFPNGEPERMLGMAVDITDRRQTEESLRLFRKLIDGSNDSFEVIDPKTLKFLDMNERGCKDLGYSREEILSLAVPDVDPGMSKSAMAAIRARLEQAETVILECLHRRKDGSTFPVEVNVRHVQADQHYLVAVVRDITERKHAEEELRGSEERLRLAAEAGKMFAYSWDAATDVITRSGESAQILGIDETAQLTGQQVIARVHPDDLGKVKDAISQICPEKPYLRVAYRMIRPNQSMIWVERNSQAYFDREGKILRIIGMVADVTERKRAEEMLSSISRRLIEAQEEERARIARELHDDIGQRLVLLALGLEQLQQAPGNLDSDARNCIAELEKQVLEISASIQSLAHDLHSSKLEHLGIVVAMRTCCVELSAKRKVTIDFKHENVPQDLPHGISLCLFRVLQESLHNAVRHSGATHFEVELQGTSDAIHLTIRDEGFGFDPSDATNRHGLGLTSMRERLRLVRGELCIQSQLRHGTTVRACVPLPEGEIRGEPKEGPLGNQFDDL